MKKIVVSLVLSCMIVILCFGISVCASDWTGGVSTGTGYDWSVSSGDIVTTGNWKTYYETYGVSFTDENVKPFFMLSKKVFYGLDSSKGDTEVVYLGYVKIVDGVITEYKTQCTKASECPYFKGGKRCIFSAKDGSVLGTYNDSVHVYIGSSYSGDIPILPYPEDENYLKVLEDYFIYGKESTAMYSPEGLVTPEFSKENIVKDDTLGYLNNLALVFVCNDTYKPNLEESGYKFTWSFDYRDYVTGSAAEIEGPVTPDGKTPDGYTTKVEIRTDLTYQKGVFTQKTVEIGTYDVFESFGAMVPAYQNNYFLTYAKTAELAASEGYDDIEIVVPNVNYLRLVQYRPDEKKFHVSSWYRIKSNGESIIASTGDFGENGSFVEDGEGPTYEVNMSDGTISGDEVPEDWSNKAESDYEFKFDSETLKDIVGSLQSIPALLKSMFSFIPSVVWVLFGVALTAVVVMRVVGR